MTAKCGEIKVWHWAHRGRRRCDPWWENETEWHRRWKGRFPDDWQEVRQKAADGEWHIADVKTERGWVLEFQHSYIKPEERRSRDAFYGKLIWVVDGLRRKTDWPPFAEAYNRGRQLLAGYPARRVDARNGALFRDWAGSDAHVFFDFGRAEIWWLMPRSDQNWAFVVGMNRREFVQLHLRAGSTVWVSINLPPKSTRRSPSP